MDLPVHGRVGYERYIEYPFFSEIYLRNELMQRDWGDKFPKLNLIDRYVENQPDDEKEYLKKSIAVLMDLKLVFQTLGAVPFSIASTTRKKKEGKYVGIPECVSTDGTRKGSVDFDKLKRLVEIESEYQTHAGSLEQEFSEQDNYNMQQFLIFNWGERLHLVTPSDEGTFIRLRKRGLSMKEIELVLFVVMYEEEVELKLPSIMGYIPKNWWSDILNFAHEYVATHADTMKELDRYMKKYVTNTFCTAIQPWIESDATQCFAVEIDKKTFIGYEEQKADGSDDENDQDKKKQKLA